MNDSIYREHILDHNANPRNFGLMEHPDLDAERVNTTCGDEIRVQATLEGDRITRMQFSGRGCAISQAAASMLTEAVVDKMLTDVQMLGPADITRLLGITPSPSRMRCALLSLETLKASIAQRRSS
ncbi:MAG: iron-sulfur cluster assembly scaffold protein [Candidatus Kerfeldbacteria bacterium]|nr:iron-sulfur cluster assembly scaffold protein [Candidatus Kerfeldbacteria bacterium]